MQRHNPALSKKAWSKFTKNQQTSGGSPSRPPALKLTQSKSHHSHLNYENELMMPAPPVASHVGEKQQYNSNRHTFGPDAQSFASNQQYQQQPHLFGAANPEAFPPYPNISGTFDAGQRSDQEKYLNQKSPGKLKKKSVSMKHQTGNPCGLGFQIDDREEDPEHNNKKKASQKPLNKRVRKVMRKNAKDKKIFRREELLGAGDNGQGMSENQNAMLVEGEIDEEGEAELEEDDQEAKSKEESNNHPSELKKEDALGRSTGFKEQKKLFSTQITPQLARNGQDLEDVNDDNNK